jgi:hypothetical protein
MAIEPWMNLNFELVAARADAGVAAWDSKQQCAAPRWEELVTRSGSGPDAIAFAVAPGAIQWRARWSCESESLTHA